MNQEAKKPETSKLPESRPQRFTGIVTKAGKMAATATVTVERLIWHPKVKKQLKRMKKYLVHDPAAIAHEGDTVVIEKCSPVSKRKHFRVLSIAKKAAVKTVIEEEKP